jgi:cell division protein FtsB
VRVRALVRALILFVGCVLVTDAVFGERGLLEMRRARRRHDELASGIATLRQQNARLREDARRLREDAAAIEAIARRDLGLIRRGELLFIVKDLPSPHRDPSTRSGLP